MTHPDPESLVPHALRGDDPVVARHVQSCDTCRAEVERLPQSAGLLRQQRVSASRGETPQCLDEIAIADFVDGRLDADARAPVVAHLLTCARCRAAVVDAGRAVREVSLTGTGSAAWRRWSIPLGAAAAAVLLLALWPRGGADRGDLREPPITGTIAPVPVSPRNAVIHVDQVVWTSVPRAEQYRVRMFDGQGSVVWTVETPDTAAALPTTVRLTRGLHYFWRVEAETDYHRTAASDLVEFEVTGHEP